MTQQDPPPHRPRRSNPGLAVGLAAGFAVLLAAFWASLSFGPVPAAIPPDPGPPAVTLLTAEGEPFASRGALRAEPVAVETLPPYVPQAFVAIEDRRFYRHHGVDLLGIARALAADIRAGAVVEGGSTITQQLVKNTDLGPEQSVGRKLREAIGALRLERRLDKGEILSRYLNTIYFGEGAYGLAAAAETYFGKSPRDLSLGEAAMLAGLVKAPTQLSPRRHLEQARARERLVLQAMVREGYVDASTAQAQAAVRPIPAQAPERFGGYFADWIYPAVSARMDRGYGRVAVRTTLDGALQQRAEAVVRSALGSYGAAGGARQAALVAMRPDGTVVAMVGGRDHGTGPFNRAVQARRQPGSTFKLFVYLAALRAGASPEDLVSDQPLKIGAWRPDNADHEHHGVLTLEEAFARSSNLAAVRVSQTVGIPQVVRTARDLGIGSPLDPVPSLALGSSGVSLLELTSAYAAVARGAYPVRPVGAPGVVEEKPGRAMDPGVRDDMLRLLQAAAARVGPAAELPIPVFGKTGTSQNFRDALFVGFTGNLVVGVWVGNDDERPMNRVYGAALPARIWADFMRTAASDEIAAAESMRADDQPYPPEDEGDPPRAPWFGGLVGGLRSLFGL